MSIKRTFALAVLASAFGAATVSAQIGETQPAEFPPGSYNGKQYVDSNGCVFVRAGIDGDVSWVPRVSRDRKLICGFRPSLAPEVAEAPAAPAPAPVEPAAAEPAQPQATAAAPVQTAPKSPPARVAQVPAPRKPAPKPVVVRQTAPKPAPQPRVVQVQRTTASPAQTTRRQQVVVAEGSSACIGASPLSQQYLRGDDVRCGPQARRILPIEVVSSSAAPVRTAPAKGQQVIVPVEGSQVVAQLGVPTVTATTRIAPKHVVQNRINTRNVAVPKGYRPVWNDDRLNPNRAEQNLTGRADMLLVWTNTVPRRLIDRRSGKDVTASVPLVYPYTSIAHQSADLGDVQIVTRDGQVMKRIKRSTGATPMVRKPVLSSRSAPKVQAAAQPKAPQRAVPKAAAGKRYVQIGTFRDADNAQKAAQGIARMGFPARIGKVRKGSKRYMTVQAGPFEGASALQSAMSRLRGAGYSDAFYR